VVGLPHDFADKIKKRLEPVVVQGNGSEITALSEAVARGVRETLDTVLDQLDAWTEWDAEKGLR
jgi:hydroxyethylthiazole kinase-like sugar kinase family protein